MGAEETACFNQAKLPHVVECLLCPIKPLAACNLNLVYIQNLVPGSGFLTFLCKVILIMIT